MGRLGRVTLLLTFLLLLDSLHGVQAGYDDNNFEEEDYVGYDNEEEPEYDYEEEGADFGASTTETVTGAEGTPPQSGPPFTGVQWTSGGIFQLVPIPTNLFFRGFFSSWIFHLLFFQLLFFEL